MAIEIVGGLERKERCHANDDRSEDFIADIEVVVREATPLVSQNAMVRILGRELGNAATEGGTLFHALEDEVDSTRILLHHPAQGRQHVVLLAHALFGPFDGNLVIAGISLDPLLVVASSLREHLLVHHRHPDDLAEEIHHLLRSRQPAQVTADDDSVEAMVYKYKQAAKQLCERLHRLSSLDQVSTTRSSVRRPVESKFQICLASLYHMLGGLEKAE